jgi:hypothetical protein
MEVACAEVNPHDLSKGSIQPHDSASVVKGDQAPFLKEPDFVLKRRRPDAQGPSQIADRGVPPNRNLPKNTLQGRFGAALGDHGALNPFPVDELGCRSSN